MKYSNHILRLFTCIWILILASFLLVGCGGGEEEEKETCPDPETQLIGPRAPPLRPAPEAKTAMPVICTVPGSCI